MWNHLNILRPHIQKPQECFLNLWRTRGVVCILITRCWTLSLLQVESGTAVSIHCYLVFQWSRGQPELVRNFLSLAAKKGVLMPGDGTSNDRISPMTLYGVFLKNKVDKTWDAEPRILIICLWLWGEGGDVARGVRARHGQGYEGREWVRKDGAEREGGSSDASGFTDISEKEAPEGEARSCSVMIVGEAERRAAYRKC